MTEPRSLDELIASDLSNRTILAYCKRTGFSADELAGRVAARTYTAEGVDLWARANRDLTPHERLRAAAALCGMVAT